MAMHKHEIQKERKKKIRNNKVVRNTHKDIRVVWWVGRVMGW